MPEQKKAGRPKEKNPRNVQLKLMITKEENEHLEQLAKERSIDKSKLIRALLFGGIQNEEFVHNMGTLPIIETWYDLLNIPESGKEEAEQYQKQINNSLTFIKKLNK